QRQGDHRLGAVAAGQRLGFAGDVGAAGATGVVLNELLLVEALLHHAFELDNKLLLLVELLGVADRLELDAFPLEPANGNAAGARALSQLITKTGGRGLEAVAGGDAVDKLESAGLALDRVLGAL